mgnify:CR=1 FL=1
MLFDKCLEAEKFEAKVWKQTFWSVPNGGHINVKTKEKCPKDDYYNFLGALSKRKIVSDIFPLNKGYNQLFPLAVN